jgi:hypothetical protein
VLVLLAVPAAGGIIYTETNCNSNTGCTTTQSYTNIGLVFPSLSEQIASAVDLGLPLPPPPYNVSQTKSLELIFLSIGPPGPGYIDLSYDGSALIGGSPAYSRGSVAGLFDWSCFEMGCTGPYVPQVGFNVHIPIVIGNTYDITIEVNSTAAVVGGSLPPVRTSQAYMHYTFSVRESTTGNDFPVYISDVPEPAGEALVGILLLTGMLWRRHRHASDRLQAP